ncbi:Biotin synthase [Pluralibacter gergoviae]|nr:Biotin synthase [Pluralibacter gergoviae]
MEVEQVLDSARKAKNAGSTRFCMGAAWKNPHERDMPYLEQMVQGVKAMGLEACMTLGTLSESQAKRLGAAGLDYYNHNLDTSPEFYGNIITTRTYQERLDTLDKVRDAGIKVCSGGIVGLGGDRQGPRRTAAAAGEPADAAGERAHQHAGEGQGHADGEQ